MTAEHAPGSSAVDQTVYEIVYDLVSVLDARMTSAGHPYALVQTESRGTCPPRGCSDRCMAYRSLFVRAVRWLEEHEPAGQPSQLALLSEPAP